MGAKKIRSYSKYTTEVLTLLGSMIRLQRRTRRMSEIDLADRVGISRATLRKIEQGNPSCEIGLALEAAAIVGVPLFSEDSTSILLERERVRDKLGLLPKQIRKKRSETDFNDSF